MCGGVGGGGGGGGVRGTEWLVQDTLPIVDGIDAGGAGGGGGMVLKMLHRMFPAPLPLSLLHHYPLRSIVIGCVSRPACHSLRGGGPVEREREMRKGVCKRRLGGEGLCERGVHLRVCVREFMRG